MRLCGAGRVTLALGFGRTRPPRSAAARLRRRTPFATDVRAGTRQGWRPPTTPGCAGRRPTCRAARRAYRLSANVLKASEDKTFPGAVVAVAGQPVGSGGQRGRPAGGKAVYFGSYREVFARDLYEAFTGLLTDGDLATARATARFLFERQQLRDGRIPRNSLLNGKMAPDTGGDQLDETAYPILMAYQAGLGGDARCGAHVEQAADFLVAHGPSFGSERWEEQGGYSPSTIAAEIAGLVAAGRIADRQGDAAAARVYRPPPTTSSARSRAGR